MKELGQFLTALDGWRIIALLIAGWIICEFLVRLWRVFWNAVVSLVRGHRAE